MGIELILADYNNDQHGKDLVMLLNAYAVDPMGGGTQLSDFTKQHLVKNLAARTDVYSVLCYVDGEPAGLINCIEGFSTFSCKPLVNIHDATVLPKFRGLGLSIKMFAKVEEEAVRRGCCKLTLEVLEGNEVARNAYLKIGFSGYELDPKAGKAMFWEKKL